MQATLAQIVELEAAKLLVFAQNQVISLSPDQVSVLEMLCKCARALRTDAPPPEDSPEGDTAADLAIVDPA